MKAYIDSGRREYPHIRTLIANNCNPGRIPYVLCCVIIISINHDCIGIRIAKGGKDMQCYVLVIGRGVLLLIENELQ